MAVFTVTESNWNSEIFWQGLEAEDEEYTLDFSELSSEFSIGANLDEGFLTMSAGGETFIVADDQFPGAADVVIGNGLQLDQFLKLIGVNGGMEVRGTTSADSIDGGDAGDTLVGREGDDFLRGQGGNDDLYGGAGHDVLETGLGDDTASGGGGNDHLSNWSGADFLSGGDDADEFVVFDGTNGTTIVGGEGGTDEDTLNLSGVRGDVKVTVRGDEVGGAEFGSDTITFSEIESFVLTDGEDKLDASESDGVSVFSGDGDDLILGGAGSDTFSGGAGHDTMEGGAGNDTIFGDFDADGPSNGGYAPLIRMDFKDGATDTSGNGYDGVLKGDANTNATGWTGADDDSALQLDGDSDFVEIPKDDAFELDQGTVSIRFNVEATGTAMGIVSRDSSYFDSGGHFDICVTETGAIALRMQTESASHTITSDDGVVTAGEWVSVSASFGPDGMSLYVDGSLVASKASYTGGLSGNQEPWTLGASQWQSGDSSSSGANRFLNGRIDEFIVTDVAMAASDIATLHAQGGDVVLAGHDQIAGGDGADSIVGGSGHDSISGDAGNDTLFGGDGADTLAGGDGDDFLDGGDGDDLLTTGLGNDTLLGGLGDDTLMNSAGDDSLVGGAGDDSIVATEGNDTLEGGSGNDTLIGGADNDSLEGGTGADALYGGTGNDYVDGGDDADTIYVEDGFGLDTVVGGEGGTDDDMLDFSAVTTDLDGRMTASEQGYFESGTDRVDFSEIEKITLGQGNDQLSFGLNSDVGLWIDGQAGDDTLMGSGQDDMFFGGEGADMMYGSSGADTLEGQSGEDELRGGSGDDVVEGGADNDKLYGEAGADSVYGGTGADTLDGGADNDSVVGGEGNDYLASSDTGSGDDTLEGGSGNDQIYTGDGSDYADGGAGNDTIYLTGGENTALGGDGDDRITTSGTSGASNIDGGAGNDTISTSDGSGNADTVVAGEGNDAVYAFDGDDEISGDAGDDTIAGGAGDDTIEGGTGADNLSGGDGDDTFVYSAGDGLDTITDFNVGNSGTLSDGDSTNNDFIDLSGFYDDIWELTADFEDDGILNQSNTTKLSGEAVSYDDNTQFAPGEGIAFTGASANSSSFTSENTGVVCFTADTLILTPSGEVPIQHLRPGDRIVTRDNGPQELLWSAARRISKDQLWRHENLRPISLSPDLTGGAARLLVSPQHGIVIDRSGGEETLVRARHLARLKGGKARIAWGHREVIYIHLMFAAHQIIFANGAPCESFYPGEQALSALDKTPKGELARIFPDLMHQTAEAAYGQTVRHVAPFRDLPDHLRDLECW